LDKDLKEKSNKLDSVVIVSSFGLEDLETEIRRYYGLGYVLHGSLVIEQTQERKKSYGVQFVSRYIQVLKLGV